jgi:hypothetical protein
MAAACALATFRQVVLKQMVLKQMVLKRFAA